ncbi:MAG: HD-GYP domain-containing protein [Gemmatimonadota bacterium]|nr:MAG: HD-GYP domain-containing protein [Gemmatimonadota bacterium]
MHNRRFQILAIVTTLLSLALLPLLDWSKLATLPVESLVGLLAMAALGLISEQLALGVRVGNAVSDSSITFLLLYGSVLLFGPEATALFASSSWFVSQFMLRRKPLPKAVFNVAQFTISAVLAGWVYAELGGRSSVDSFEFSLAPFAAFAATFSVTNLLLVSLALSILEGSSLRDMVGRLGGPKGSHIAYDFLVSPVSLLITVLYIEYAIWGLVGVALTLFFIRRSYLTNYQLQQALKHLLKVLVKAIETRDPYTSGHSQRVSWLSKLIAEQMGFPTKKVEAIETAALLHDIGKIEEIYTDILRKPSGLSADERTIIESHVITGAELLRSHTAFPPEIIDAVKYHHERVDGRGYPDGLRGHQIPIGARIIKVCDAIDAMLSDRPYRKALALPAVREQLCQYAGTQFDEDVVAAVVARNFLEEHAAELLRQKEEVHRHPAMDDSLTVPIGRGDTVQVISIGASS